MVDFSRGPSCLISKKSESECSKSIVTGYVELKLWNVKLFKVYYHKHYIQKHEHAIKIYLKVNAELGLIMKSN